MSTVNFSSSSGIANRPQRDRMARRKRSLSEHPWAAERALKTNRPFGKKSPNGAKRPVRLSNRVSQKGRFLTTRSGTLEAIYQHNVAIARVGTGQRGYFFISRATTTKSH